MNRRTASIALLASGLLWLTCTPPEVLTPSMYLTPRPRSIDDQGERTNLTVYVADSDGVARSGSVTITARAGAFSTGGKSVTLDLDEGGHASVDWSCAVAMDANCKGEVRLEARWELGTEFLVQVVRIAVGPPDLDAGTDGGSPGDGGSTVDAGQPIGLVSSEVYVLGTLQEGACYMDALANPRNPTAASVGFPCYTSSPKLQGSALLYLDQASNTLYRFVPDRFTRSTPQVPWAYPAMTTSNDTVVMTSNCSGVSAFWPGPDLSLLYRCSVGGEFRRDGNLVTMPTGGSPLALGAGGVILVSAFTTVSMLAVDGGAIAVATDAGTPLTEGPARWAADGGFFIAPQVMAGLTRTLYRVDLNGLAEPVGDFATEPNGVTLGYEEVLSGNNTLVVIGNSSAVDQIVELPLVPGTSNIIYSEANATPNDFTGPVPRFYVRLHASDLVTGP